MPLRLIVEGNLELPSIKRDIQKIFLINQLSYEYLVTEQFKARFNSWDEATRKSFCRKLAGLRHKELYTEITGTSNYVKE